jgi:molybdopterin-guanine dinucleotide biosynthesis protein B
LISGGAESLSSTVVAVVGGKKSGKTTAIEVLVRELSRRGYKIAVVKHISDPDFTIDREGKDTWRFAEAGAMTVVSVAAREIATVEKKPLKNLTLGEILQRCRGADIVFLEGFRKLVGRNTDVRKIVAVKASEDVAEATENFGPIIAFVGRHSTEHEASEIPYINVLEDSKGIADLVENAVRKKTAREVYCGRVVGSGEINRGGRWEKGNTCKRRR